MGLFALVTHAGGGRSAHTGVGGASATGDAEAMGVSEATGVAEMIGAGDVFGDPPVGSVEAPQAATPATSPTGASPGSSAPASVPPSAPVVASASPDASASPVAEAPPTPVCTNRPPPAWVTSAKSPTDGVPDPAGRIFFAQFSYNTEVLGQVVAPMYAIDPDGSDLVQLLDCDIERPRVSPDGTRLGFSIVMSDGVWQVATSAVDGSDLRILTDGPGYAETPDWSPDGEWLIYSRASQACLTASWDD